MKANETDLLMMLIEKAPFALPDTRIFRRQIVNMTSTVGGRTFRVRNGIEGQGDAYALVRGGRHIEIETKAADGRMRLSQKRWQAFCARWEIPHLVLTARKGEDSDATVSRWISELQVVVCA